MSEKRKNPKPTQEKAQPLTTALQLSKEEALVTELEDVTPIIEFLENFKAMVDPKAQQKSQLISMKVPVPLLEAFKARAQLQGVPYQTLIKSLMLDYLRR